mmetsp:Transcript_12767/g.28041  ORF Transcript_12767/g.28041 Transcript_12767/m.28041 type:complete len:214 (-) Transcript_12767:80-721(-)
MGNCGARPSSSSAVVVKASKEALAVDTDQDGRVSKEELAKYIDKHAELWAMLSVNCGIDESECRKIATHVAFRMAKVKHLRSSMTTLPQQVLDREPTVQEFQTLLDWLNEPRGNLEFFHRTVFSAFDKNGNGYLEPDELDAFLDVYYQAGSIFAGDVRLPEKATLKQNLLDNFDTDGDGQISFRELQSILQAGGSALVTEDRPPQPEGPAKLK